MTYAPYGRGCYAAAAVSVCVACASLPASRPIADDCFLCEQCHSVYDDTVEPKKRVARWGMGAFRRNENDWDQSGAPGVPFLLKGYEHRVVREHIHGFPVEQVLEVARQIADSEADKLLALCLASRGAVNEESASFQFAAPDAQHPTRALLFFSCLQGQSDAMLMGLLAHPTDEGYFRERPDFFLGVRGWLV